MTSKQEYRKELYNILIEDKETGLRWNEYCTIESSEWDMPYQDIAMQMGLTSGYIILHAEPTGILYK